VRDLAARIAGPDRVPFVVASKIEEYLRDNYPYAMSVGRRPPLRDAVAYFLFDAQKGYFDYHASAMTVLLRALDIPARLAIGFALDDSARDPQTNLITVSEQNSWAWTEVYFPGYGWIEFNPTPGLGGVARATDDSQFVDPTTGLPFEDPLLEGIDPNLIPPELLMQPDAGAGGVDAGAEEGVSGFNTPFAWLLALAALVIVGAGVGRFVWVSSFRGLPPASQRWAKLQTLAGWAGYPTRAQHTPHEAAAVLSASIRPRVDVRPLAKSYVAERYGGDRARDAAEDTADLEALYAKARGRLARRALGRFLKFGR
jgi:transglutaminase-like putative cysteine protease